jgi:hypothetical protein
MHNPSLLTCFDAIVSTPHNEIQGELGRVTQVIDIQSRSADDETRRARLVREAWRAFLIAVLTQEYS